MTKNEWIQHQVSRLFQKLAAAGPKAREMFLGKLWALGHANGKSGQVCLELYNALWKKAFFEYVNAPWTASLFDTFQTIPNLAPPTTAPIRSVSKSPEAVGNIAERFPVARRSWISVDWPDTNYYDRDQAGRK